MDWEAIDVLGEFVGAIGSLLIACVVAYIAARQWLDGRRFERERRELTKEIERGNEAAKAEQERIIRAQSLDAYFDGISNLLLRDGGLDATARNLAKGRTDAILTVLKSDEKRNLVAFLYGSGLITLDAEGPDFVGDSRPGRSSLPTHRPPEADRQVGGFIGGDNSLPVVGLSGSDLSRAELSGSTLRKASLSMVNLRGAQISEADLDEADLRGADLREADLRGADLSRANLHGALAAAAILSEVDLSEADLSGADLRGGDFSGADLSGSNLSGANLRGANLSGADLRAANLSGANLREAILTGANLLEARLDNLTSVDSADFTEVTNLAAETRGYLCSIASGTHPDTGRDTRATLAC